MSKRTAKTSNKKWYAVVWVLTAIAAYWYTQVNHTLPVICVAAGLGVSLYIKFLVSYLELDNWDRLQILLGVSLGVLGLAMAERMPYPYHQALLVSYWIILILMAHWEKQGNWGEVAWYAFWFWATLAFKDFLAVTVQDIANDIVLVNSAPMIGYIYIPAVVAPLMYNFIMQPIGSRVVAHHKARVKAGEFLIAPIKKDLKKATVELPLATLGKGKKLVSTATQTMKAVVPEGNESKKKNLKPRFSWPFWKKTERTEQE